MYNTGYNLKVLLLSYVCRLKDLRRVNIDLVEI